MRDKPNLLDWLGIKREPDFSKAKWLGGFVSILLVLLMVALGGSTLFQFLEASIGWGDYANDKEQAEAIRNSGLVLAAIIGVPFIIWRTSVAQKQADTAEQGHITDRISKAVEQIGSESVVTGPLINSSGKRVFEKDGDGNLDFARPVTFEKTEPNLEVRIGGLFALERIAKDSPIDHLQIVEILCAYIRNNAPVANAGKSPHEVFTTLTSSTEDAVGLNAEDAFQQPNYKATNNFGWNPTELTDKNLERWANDLPKPRADIAIALKIIGRRPSKMVTRENMAGFRVNLEYANLQGSELKGDFSNACFASSALDGAILNGNFKNCNLRYSKLQATVVGRVALSQTDFSRANLDSAYFGGAVLDGSRFWYCRMKKTNFNGASLIATDWLGVISLDVYFHQNADISHSRIMETNITELNGLLEGPSASLWIGRNVTMTEEQLDIYPKTAGSDFEIDFRKRWHLDLSDRGLKFIPLGK